MKGPRALRLASAALASAALVAAQNLDTSHILVWRMGDGTAPAVASNAQPYFLDSYAIAADGSFATLARTIAMPTTGTNACTGSGTTVMEGGGSLSFDGRYLTTPCFTGPVGTTTVNSNSAYPQRQINRIRADGAVHHGEQRRTASCLVCRPGHPDPSSHQSSALPRQRPRSSADGHVPSLTSQISISAVRFSDIGTGNIRGVVSFNGTDYYFQAGGGVRFVGGSTTLDTAPSGTVFTSTAIPNVYITTLTSHRGVTLVADTPGVPQLVMGFSAASNNCGLFSIGTGLPVGTVTAALQLNCTWFNMQTFVSFQFESVNSLWAASASGGLFKFVAGPRNSTQRLLGTQWQLAPGYPVNQSFGGGLRYITGRNEASGYVLYGISDVFAGSTSLLRFVPSTSTWTVLAQSGANRWFRGVYPVPCDPAINGPW